MKKEEGKGKTLKNKDYLLNHNPCVGHKNVSMYWRQLGRAPHLQESGLQRRADDWAVNIISVIGAIQAACSYHTHELRCPLKSPRRSRECERTVFLLAEPSKKCETFESKPQVSMRDSGQSLGRK